MPLAHSSDTRLDPDTTRPGIEDSAAPRVRRALVAALVVCLSLLPQAACVGRKCSKTLAQAPEVRGFRLGMTLEEVRGRYPGLSVPAANEFGLTTITLTPSAMADAAQRPELADTKSVTLDAVDGRLASIKVKYTNAQKWQSVDDFLKRVAESFGLDGDWEKSKTSKEMRWQWCNGFHLYAGFKTDYGEHQSYPYLELEDTEANITPQMRAYQKRKRQEAAEEERRKTFRP